MLTFTPAELHDSKHQPDIKNGGEIGMPLDRFVDDAYAGLAARKDEVTVGPAKGWYDSFEPARQKVFSEFNEEMKKVYAKD